jgi:hypothetical protein
VRTPTVRRKPNDGHSSTLSISCHLFFVEVHKFILSNGLHNQWRMRVDEDLAKGVCWVYRVARIDSDAAKKFDHCLDTSGMNAVFRLFQAEDSLEFRIQFQNAQHEKAQRSIGKGLRRVKDVVPTAHFDGPCLGSLIGKKAKVLHVFEKLGQSIDNGCPNTPWTIFLLFQAIDSGWEIATSRVDYPGITKERRSAHRRRFEEQRLPRFRLSVHGKNGGELA